MITNCTVVSPVTDTGASQLSMFATKERKHITASIVSLRSYYTYMRTAINDMCGWLTPEQSMRLFMIAGEVYVVCAGTSRYPSPMDKVVLCEIVLSELKRDSELQTSSLRHSLVELAGGLSDLYLTQPYMSHALVSGHPTVDDNGYDLNIDCGIHYAPHSWWVGKDIIQLRTLRMET